MAGRHGQATGAGLSRWGTARLRALEHDPGEPKDATATFFRRLARGAGLHDLGDDSVCLAEEIVRMQPMIADAEAESLAMLVVAAMASARQGSTRLPLGGGTRGYLGGLLRQIADAAGVKRPVRDIVRDIDRIARAPTSMFGSVIGGPHEYRPLIYADGSIHLQRLFVRERRLALGLGDRLAREPEDAPVLDAAIADVRARPAVRGGDAIQLSDEQLAAIAAAARHPLAVISGGPGTGKTAIVVALLRALVRAGTRADAIVLAAPTGKAAQRMASSVRAGLDAIAEPADADRDLARAPPEPRTLHRLLGYLPSADRFRHHENHPVPADVVIVDEASMIDLDLAERLVRAVRPDARLVLLGDADQLPSVDAGAVFRDLVALGADQGFASRLTRSYRMDPRDPAGRAILSTAGAIGRGDARAVTGASGDARVPVRERTADLRHDAVELLATRGEPARLAAALDAWFGRFVAPDADTERRVRRTYAHRGGRIVDGDRADIDALLSRLAGYRLLTVTRRLATGARAINAHLHGRTLETATADHRPDFYPGEPVLMRRNDYRRRLFNGDQGVVLRVADGGSAHRFCAVFPREDGYAVFPIDTIRPHLELAYAMTVHQSQGSEFDHVALVLPHADLPLLTRELLYTAITRARRSAAIVGARALLTGAIRRSSPRYTQLAP